MERRKLSYTGRDLRIMAQGHEKLGKSRYLLFWLRDKDIIFPPNIFGFHVYIIFLHICRPSEANSK